MERQKQGQHTHKTFLLNKIEMNNNDNDPTYTERLIVITIVLFKN